MALRAEGGLFPFSIIIATSNLSFSPGLIDSRIYESEYRIRGHCYSCGLV
jgi:hypothetical protein